MKQGDRQYMIRCPAAAPEVCGFGAASQKRQERSQELLAELGGKPQISSTLAPVDDHVYLQPTIPSRIRCVRTEVSGPPI